MIRVVSEADGIVAVCLEGEFDLANAPDLRDRTEQALEQGTALIFDVSEATFIDSSVIEIVIRASKAAAADDKPIVLQLGTAAVVERAIEITGIERVLPRAHNRQEAVRIIRQQQASPDLRDAKRAALTEANGNILQVAAQSIAEGLTWEFFCECGDPDCHAQVLLTVDGYEELRNGGSAILAPGHRVGLSLV